MKRTRPVRKLQAWQREHEYGWVVKVAKVREPNTTYYVCMPSPACPFGLTTNLMEALWFPNDERAEAEAFELLQTGIAKAARRDTLTGTIELLYE